MKRLMMAASFLIGASAALADTYTVSSVAELQTRLANAETDDEIIIAGSTTPYDLTTVDCMSRAGHLYAAVRITLRGATGNPADVVLLGSTNRVLYLGAVGNTIRDITFKGGDCSKNPKDTSNVPKDNQNGGGICIGATQDTSTISNCVFSGCKAVGGGGASMWAAAQNNKNIRYAGDFRDCVFTNCTATSSGGGMYCGGVLRKCTFVDNVAGVGGGGAFQCHFVEDCDFTGNHAVYGGGLSGSGTTAETNFVVTGCNFYTNSVSGAYGGGGISCATYSMFASTLLVTNCYFGGNIATNVYIGGGAIATVSNIVDCTLAQNLGYYGGAVYCSELRDCIIRDNFTRAAYAFDKVGGTNMLVATCYGGGVHKSTLTRCTVSGNTAESIAGGAYQSILTDCTVSGNTAVTCGGAYDSTLTGCRVEGNQASSNNGGGAYLGTLTGCTISGNIAGNAGGAAYQSTLIGCRIEGNTANYGAGASSSTLLCCTNSGNIGIKTAGGSEIYHSIATGCVFDHVGCDGKSTFHGSALDQCTITATNGYAFGGSNNGITNCLITGGSGFYVFYNPTRADGPVNLVNCTIVSNQYTRYSAGGGCQPVVDVVNCYFYGNRFGDKYVYDLNSSADTVINEFKNCIYSHKSDYTPPGNGNTNYYYVATFKPGFVGAAKDPEHPYAITRKSPAFHENGVVTGDATPWTASDTDIRGAGFPRLRDGKVDIGCYQCWLNPLGLAVSIR